MEVLLRALRGIWVHLQEVLTALLSGPRPNGSLSVVLSYLNGSKQRIPKRCLTFVDVRDVALAHIAALESPSASGRHLVVGSRYAGGVKRDA